MRCFNGADKLFTLFPELGQEEPQRPLVGFEKGENKESSKTESEENSSDGSCQNSPRGVLETPTSSVHSDSGSSNESSSSIDRSLSPEGTVLECHSSQWRNLIGGLLQRKKRSIMRLSTFPPAMKASCLERKCLGISQSGEEQSKGGLVQLEIPMRKPCWRNFDHQELVVATDNFSHENLIGKGGHAEVYKGCLPDGQLVAVKRLTKKDKEEERIGDFLSELGIIAHVNHPNAAQLLGFGVEGGLHMVLQFSPHGSLASVLHGGSASKGRSRNTGVMEEIRSQGRRYLMPNTFKWPILEQWSIHQPFGLPSHKLWCPAPGWLKFNVDASLRTSNLLGLGIVTRNHVGALISAAGRRMEHWDILQAEVMAVSAIREVLMDWMFDLEGIIIEGDSMINAIQWMQNLSNRQNQALFRAEGPDISFLVDFKQVLFRYIPRESNRPTNYCARLAVLGEFTFFDVNIDEFPSTLLSLLREESDKI
ncbi:Receptor-like cytosolic serine/threonine-protein kinase RBK1 [Dendrobium catenatum]|uniref:Receptor-like cytosolic serine/threonine-protein kinase RBK1 n=1 Tax=Dendrobium catenatum TaxID=906689 RepID=A0A2I0WCV1_9ASPA|nr:Receptor-like cytosolic serine/threonine-protein kinase RBK1 [Dendrobium catenatum]